MKEWCLWEVDKAATIKAFQDYLTDVGVMADVGDLSYDLFAEIQAKVVWLRSTSSVAPFHIWVEVEDE